MALSTMSYGIMGMVDTLFVARLGESALAGVGLATVLGFTLVVFPFGIMRGAKVRVSQWVGADRHEELPLELTTTRATALVLGVVTSCLALGCAFALRVVAPDPDAGAAASDYLFVWAFGGPMMVLKVGLREFRYGVGDSRGPLLASVAGNLVNLALDPLLIFTLDFGVAGAAAATLCAHGMELGILLRVQRGHALPRRLPPLERVRALLSVGVPTGLQMFFEISAFTVLTFLIGSYSTRDLAAHQVALQIIHLSFLPALAASEAASVLAGQAVGARQPELVKGVARHGLVLVLGYALLWTVILWTAAEPIAQLFTKDHSLLVRVVALLHIAATFQLFDAAQMMARAVLRGTGDVVAPAIIGIAISWLVTPGLGWLLVHQADLGGPGGWAAITLEVSLAAVLYWHRFLRGRWRGKAVHQPLPRLSNALHDSP